MLFAIMLAITLILIALFVIFNTGKRSAFYDYKKYIGIISQYPGNWKTQTLLALDDRSLSIKDIRKFRISGTGGSNPDDKYILIRKISKHMKDIRVFRFKRGASYSRLEEVSLQIINGEGVIIERWS